jgi:hypothetical protein
MCRSTRDFRHSPMARSTAETPVRHRLLQAAMEIFAAKGYHGAWQVKETVAQWLVEDNVDRLETNVVYAVATRPRTP